MPTLATIVQPTSPDLVHYTPILTTVLSAAFVAMLVVRARKRRWAPHLVWWAIGIFWYGVGTALESTITLFGNTPELTRWWYWAGAILGGYPLGTGSLYLLGRRRMAHTFTAISMVVVVVATVAIFLTPLREANLEGHRPNGAVLEWQWIRAITPLINIYALVWLVGGAAWSSYDFFFNKANPKRAAGTALIAVGGLLPAFGGTMTKMGHVEWLYVGEFAGLVLIIAGYMMCIRAPAPTGAPAADTPRDAESPGGMEGAAS